MERFPRTSQDHLRSIIADAEAGKTRNPFEDARTFLELEQVTVRSVFQEQPDPNKPLLITPNHYLRTCVQRRSVLWFSSVDSFIDSSIATLGSGKEQVVWVLKKLPDVDLENVSIKRFPRKVNRIIEDFVRKYPKIIGIIINDARIARKAQNVFEDVYGYLVLEDKLSRESATKFIEGVDTVMKNNGTLYAFAEMNPSTTLSEPYPGYKMLLKRMSDYDYQVWPVSIHADGRSNYTANFGRIIEQEGRSPEVVITFVMAELARNLPPKLRGLYTNWID